MSSPAESAVRDLAGCVDPYVIGVRHHSPALSVVVPALLEAARPDVLLVELPAEFESWLPWLAHPQTTAPVALAGVAGGLAFYPFADFSPELVALRWAARNQVRVVPCDLPLADRGWARHPDAPGPGSAPGSSGPVDLVPGSSGPVDLVPGSSGPGPEAGGGPWLAEALKTSATGRPDEDMWDRVVEARAPGCDPEAIRRAALLVGWALRGDAVRRGGVDPVDLRREAWMRRCLAANAGGRLVALVGAFHAPALVSGWGDAPAPDLVPGAAPVTSLVPYAYPLLDSRSGYPAGIRDPQWQQAVLGAAGDPEAVTGALTDTVVRVCAAIRAAGHPAGPGEAREAARLATDLARLRGLPAPGRGELVEALQSVLAHGEVLGRGRVVAAAMERVLVGSGRGTLAPGTPKSGLSPAVRALLAELTLPGPGDPPKELRLDPLRSDLDRRREVALRQLEACQVPYAQSIATEGIGGGPALTARWQVAWSPQTDLMLDVAGLRGVTLPQAAAGALRERRRRAVGAHGPTAAQVIDDVAVAAQCGLVDLAAEGLAELATVVPTSATLAELISALGLLDRLRLGHVPALPDPVAAGLVQLTSVTVAVEAAAERQVDGVAGSEDPADAQALAALARRADAAGVGLRLADALGRLATTGTPMIAAAAAGVRVLLGLGSSVDLGIRIASWVDAAVTPDARRNLQAHLTGLLTVAEPLLHTGDAAMTGLLDRVANLGDTEFLRRLPALRGGFHVLSPAARGRLLAVIDERLGGTGAEIGEVADPDALLARLLADRAGLLALAGYGLTVQPEDPTADQPIPGAAGPGIGAGAGVGPGVVPGAVPEPGVRAEPEPGAGVGVVPESGVGAEPRTLGVADRWRLILGRQTENLSAGSARYATALDELYGAGRGEGAAAEAAGRAGRGASFPGVREWSEEIAQLFGAGVREEVLARAVEAGRLDAAMALDPEAVRPSVRLLQTVLSLAGGLPESAVARLRPLVARIVDDLTRQLAVRLRPALTGLTTPRPTFRPGGGLDLARTVRANLATSRREPDGTVTIVPERPVFRSRSRRGVDWRLILVVDVSGSMEASVIWSALTAAVLAGVPALTTHFIAFSTEVADLTDRVDDPLGLLLEVRVGGGTHIAAGLRHARSLVTVPSRTIVAVVSDFEEGYPLGGLLSEVRALVEAGCTVLGCASLDDTGSARYCVATAGQLVAAGMPVAALSPLELARWVGEQVRA